MEERLDIYPTVTVGGIIDIQRIMRLDTIPKILSLGDSEVVTSAINHRVDINPVDTRVKVEFYATTYPYIGNMDAYLSVDRNIASEVATLVIGRMASLPWNPRYGDIIRVLALFIRQGDVDQVIAMLGNRTPISLAYVPYVGHDIQEYMDNDVPIDFLYHYLLRPGSHVTLGEIAGILSYPPSILRERTYYLALYRYIDDHPSHGYSEVDILRMIPQTHGVSRRLARIEELFPTRGTTFPLDGCHNDMGLTDSMDEVPPILRYQIQTGNEGDPSHVYCLSASDIYGMVIAGNTRNPYTGTSLDTDRMMEYLYDLLEQGYPVGISTAFYDPIMGDIPTTRERIDTMVYSLDLGYYRDNIDDISDRLGLSPLALQKVPLLIKVYDGNISTAIDMAYPHVSSTVREVMAS